MEKVFPAFAKRLLLYAALYSVAVAVFLGGFFLSRTPLEERSSCEEPPWPQGLAPPSDARTPCWMDSQFNRAVIIVVDALRMDFVAPPREGSGDVSPTAHMPFLREMLSHKGGSAAALYTGIADAPTVTTQRLQGIAAGTLPTFFEVVSSFTASSFEEDSWVRALNSTGKRSFFVGDDTWSSLFPEAFTRSYGYPSFDVKDLDTVDNGVIAHLVPELRAAAMRDAGDFTGLPRDPDGRERGDWDVLVAHYLGVDHAGHRYHASHAALHAKLRQMDDELRRAVDALPAGTLLVVLGDHGMTSDGNHGGASEEETGAALLFYSKEGRLHARGGQPPASVRQIDLVPSLCLALGLPVPYGNLGAAIPAVVGATAAAAGGDGERVRSALRLNAGQVRRYLRAYAESGGGGLPLAEAARLESLFEEARAAALAAERGAAPAGEEEARWMAFLREAQEATRRRWTTFDVPSMVGGLVAAAAVVAAAAADAALGRVPVPYVLRAMHAQRAPSPFQGVMELASAAGRAVSFRPRLRSAAGVVAVAAVAAGACARIVPALDVGSVAGAALGPGLALLVVAAAAAHVRSLLAWRSPLRGVLSTSARARQDGRARGGAAAALRALPRASLALVLLALHAAGLFSNSYVAAQPAAVHFLLATLAAGDAVACVRARCGPAALLLSLAPLACARLARAGAGSWHGPDAGGAGASALASLAPLVLAPLAAYAELVRTDTVRGAGRGVLVLSLLAGLSAAAGWSAARGGGGGGGGVSDDGASGGSDARGGVMLQLSLLLSCAALALAAYQPLTSTAMLLKRRVRAARPGQGGEDGVDTSVRLLGVPRAARSSLLVPLVPLVPLGSVLMGPASPGLLLVWGVHVAAVAATQRALATATATRPGPAGPAVYAQDLVGGDGALEEEGAPVERGAGAAAFALLAAWHYYFCAGHSNAFSGIDFAAGSAAVGRHSLVASGALVALNTAFFHVAVVLALPFLLTAASCGHGTPLPARPALDAATARAAAAEAEAEAEEVDGGGGGGEAGTGLRQRRGGARGGKDSAPVPAPARAVHWASQWSTPDMGTAALPDPSRLAQALGWVAVGALASGVAAMAGAFALRRHLMVWAVFAPKLLFELLGAVAVLAGAAAAWALYTRVWLACHAFMVYNVWCYAQPRQTPL